MAVFLHTRVRVSDLDKSIQYYCDHFGFVVASRSEKSPAGNQICHLELPGNEHTLELTYSDLIAFCDELEKKGLDIWPGDWRETFPTGRKMAFVDDPDGYEIELLER